MCSEVEAIAKQHSLQVPRLLKAHILPLFQEVLFQICLYFPHNIIVLRYFKVVPCSAIFKRFKYNLVWAYCIEQDVHSCSGNRRSNSPSYMFVGGTTNYSSFILWPLYFVNDVFVRGCPLQTFEFASTNEDVSLILRLGLEYPTGEYDGEKRLAAFVVSQLQFHVILIAVNICSRAEADISLRRRILRASASWSNQQIPLSESIGSRSVRSRLWSCWNRNCHKQVLEGRFVNASFFDTITSYFPVLGWALEKLHKQRR